MINKYLSFIVVITFLFIVSCASKKDHEIFEKYDGQEGFSLIKLPPKLFVKLVASEIDVSPSDFGSIQIVRLLTFNNEKSLTLSCHQVEEELKDKLRKYGYKSAIEFTNEGTSISAYMLKNKDYISDLMILISEEDNFVGIEMSGELDAKSILNFASSIDFDSLNDFSFIK